MGKFTIKGGKCLHGVTDYCVRCHLSFAQDRIEKLETEREELWELLSDLPVDIEEMLVLAREEKSDG